MRIRTVLALVLLAASVVLVAPRASDASAGPAEGDGYHPNTVLVRFDPDASEAVRGAAHAVLGGRVVNTMEWLDLDVVWLPDGLDPAVAAVRYNELPGVALASVNKEIRALAEPNDVLFDDQWGFQNTGQSVAGSLINGVNDFDIDAPEAWGSAFPNGFESTGGTRVAVLDTGIDLGHVDLLGKVKECASATSAIGVVVRGSCSDDGAHGTHTGGTVAANTNNNIGVAGTAPNAELAIFKFLNAAGVGFVADEIAGIRWAYQESGAKVISMSYGSGKADGTEEQELNNAYAAGLLLVAAAGNDFDATKSYPAYYNSVMSVASTTANDDISDFSTCNADVEIAAPGEDVWSTLPGNAYGLLSGTSMATPHVAGAGALLMSEKGLSNSQARQAIVNSGTDVTGSDGGRAFCGPIRQINLAVALGGGGAPPPPPTPGAIAGTVTESGKNKPPIASATVNCGSAGSALTASNGTYTISNVAPTTYTCTASKTGYVSKSQQVSVSGGATTTANFALRKA